MDTQTLEQPLQVAQAEWKTEEYHGKLMHVCAALRSHDNPAITGHGQQWDFTVNITEENAGPTAPPLAQCAIQSGPALLNPGHRRVHGFSPWPRANRKHLSAAGA
jgi:hypothetical protein